MYKKAIAVDINDENCDPMTTAKQFLDEAIFPVCSSQDGEKKRFYQIFHLPVHFGINTEPDADNMLKLKTFQQSVFKHLAAMASER